MNKNLREDTLVCSYILAVWHSEADSMCRQDMHNKGCIIKRLILILAIMQGPGDENA